MPAVAGFVIILRLLGLFQLPELVMLDQFFRWQPLTHPQHPVVIVGVTETDLSRLREWPLSDARLAELLRKINAHQPAAIGLDIYRPFPVGDGAMELRHLFQTTPNLIGVQKVLANNTDNSVAPPPVLKELDQVGAVDIVTDIDGRVRRGLLSIEKQGSFYYSLPLRLALLYLEPRGITPEPVDQAQTIIQLGKARFTALQRHDGSYTHVDAGGYQIMLTYRGWRHVPGDRHSPFPIVPVSDVLDNKVDDGLMHDRIVLIGSIAESLKDFFATPFSQGPASTGVEIHAELVSQILSAALEGKPLFQFWPDPLEYLWIAGWASIGAILGWVLRGPFWSLLAVLIAVVALASEAYLAFLAKWWIPLVPPMVALLGATTLSRFYGLASMLRQSYRQLADYSQQLELKVFERTRDLEIEIQERKQAEEALRVAKEQADMANRAKSVFLSKMSHELRTPLNAILGFTQVLHRDAHLQPDQRSYLDIISRSGEHLLTLINDVLDMSKIEAGKVTLNEDVVNLRSTIVAIVEMLQLKAQAKGLNLEIDYAADLPTYVKTDESKLRQILINLLGNAIKFTQQGRVTLHVQIANPQGSSATARHASNTWSPTDNPRTMLQFDVEDTGPGIAPEELDLLFGSFSQTETGRKSQEGSGLGLLITRQFVQLMGGTINVRSTLNAGTTFTVVLPVQVVNALQFHSHQPLRRVTGLSPNQPSYRILVVEDHLENQELLVRLLTLVGFQVRAASNGVEAIQQWDEWSPDLIWMDLQMPVMDGYEATRQIRERERTKQLTPLDQMGDRLTTTQRRPTIIIANTASAFEDERPKVLAAGCDDLVLKPLQDHIIFSMMSHYLGVRYQYDDDDAHGVNQHDHTTDDSSSTPSQAVLTASDLAIMPPQWITDLHQAALCADDDLILQLLADIPASHQAIAQQLRTLVTKFRFDQIIHLTSSET
ncbi:MAG: CHASE2 domain-containing protein [Cyanobacteria bacterium]|nr:CHASE2 domain-containing protein [Cyanobacteriota bacterium]MDW8200633.1 CHASE2 domain-containing protein [Cyanobacteriota bacterium SKYGB_h_bin112]